MSEDNHRDHTFRRLPHQKGIDKTHGKLMLRGLHEAIMNPKPTKKSHRKLLLGVFLILALISTVIGTQIFVVLQHQHSLTYSPGNLAYIEYPIGTVWTGDVDYGPVENGDIVTFGSEASPLRFVLEEVDYPYPVYAKITKSISPFGLKLQLGYLSQSPIEWQLRNIGTSGTIIHTFDGPGSFDFYYYVEVTNPNPDTSWIITWTIDDTL